MGLTAEELLLRISIEQRGSQEVDKLAQSLNRAEDSSKKLGTTLRAQKSNLEGMRDGFNMLRNTVLGTVAAFAGLKIAQFIGESAQEFAKLQSAMLGLESATKFVGESLSKTQEAAKMLASDGLMTVSEAALGLKNLLLSGFGLDQAIALMQGFKDTAAFGRQAALEFGYAVTSATEGIKNQNSILVDNAGLTKNLSVIMKEAGFQLQDIASKTEGAAARQALYNGLLREMASAQGNAAKMSENYEGQMAKVNATMKTFKQTIGALVVPVLAELAEVFGESLNDIKGFLEKNEDAIANWARAVGLAIKAVITPLLILIDLLNGDLPGATDNVMDLAQGIAEAASKSEEKGSLISNAFLSISKTIENAREHLRLFMGDVAAMQAPEIKGIAEGVIDAQGKAIAVVQGLQQQADEKYRRSLLEGAALAKQLAQDVAEAKAAYLNQQTADTEKALEKALNAENAYRKQSSEEAQREAKRLSEALRKEAFDRQQELYEMDRKFAEARYELQETFGEKWVRVHEEFAEAVRLKEQGVIVEDWEDILDERQELTKQAMEAEKKVFLDAFNFMRDRWQQWAEEQRRLALERTKNMIDERQEEIKKQLEEQEKKLEANIKKWKEWSNLFDVMSKEIAGPVGKIAGILSNFTDNYAEALKDNVVSTKEWAGIIGQVFIQLANEIEGTTGKILSAIGQLALGFAAGGWWGVAAAGIGILAGSLSEMGGELAGAAAELQTFTAGLGLFNVSNELAIKMAATMREIGTYAGTVAVHLADIAAEIEVTERNVVSFINAFIDALDQFQVGSVRMEQVVEGLNKTFAALAENATDDLGLISQELLALIAHVEELGQSVASMSDFLIDQTKRGLTATLALIETWAASLEKGFARMSKFDPNIFLPGGGPGVPPPGVIGPPPEGEDALDGWIKRTQGKLEDYVTMILEYFNELRENGVSLADAIKEISPAFDTLLEAMKKYGLEGSIAFDVLVDFKEMVEKFPRAFAQLENSATVLITLANLGRLNDDTFNSLERTMTRAFRRIMVDGKLSATEFSGISDKVYLLYRLSQQYGFQLDANTKRIIEQAKRQGLWNEEMANAVDPQQAMLEVMQEIRDILVELKNGALGYSQALAGIPEQINTTITTDYQTTGEPPPKTGRDPYYPGPGLMSLQGLRYPYGVQYDGQRFELHRGESVMPSIENAAPGVYSGSSEVAVYVNFRNVTYVGDEKFDDTITTRMERGYIAPKRTRQRDRGV